MASLNSLLEGLDLGYLTSRLHDLGVDEPEDLVELNIRDLGERRLYSLNVFVSPFPFSFFPSFSPSWFPPCLLTLTVGITSISDRKKMFYLIERLKSVCM